MADDHWISGPSLLECWRSQTAHYGEPVVETDSGPGNRQAAAHAKRLAQIQHEAGIPHEKLAQLFWAPLRLTLPLVPLAVRVEQQDWTNGRTASVDLGGLHVGPLYGLAQCRTAILQHVRTCGSTKLPAMSRESPWPLSRCLGTPVSIKHKHEDVLLSYGTFALVLPYTTVVNPGEGSLDKGRRQ